MDDSFSIEFLDHVAILVKDLDISVTWYQEVMGLKKYKLKKWGEFPIFMLTNKTGVAIFPADLNGEILNTKTKNIEIDHFAFNVTQENFEKAKRKFTKMDIQFIQKDHHYFESIYLKDPDNHTVELTTIKVNEKEFYQ